MAKEIQPIGPNGMNIINWDGNYRNVGVGFILLLREW